MHFHSFLKEQAACTLHGSQCVQAVVGNTYSCIALEHSDALEVT